MNQILFCKNSKRKNYKNVVMACFFYIFLFLFVFLFIYICRYYFKLSINNKKSKFLLQSFNISSLYAYDNSYNSSYISTSYEPSVVGTLEIDKINLHYPILSYSSESNLRISLCRFAGPMPNEIGNLCIAGHNNIDNSFFGRLSLLDVGDVLQVYDMYGNVIVYRIYDKYEILKTDFSCALQDTGGKRVVTLMTCNSLKDTRIILKAMEISI